MLVTVRLAFTQPEYLTIENTEQSDGLSIDTIHSGFMEILHGRSPPEAARIPIAELAILTAMIKHHQYLYV